MQNFAFVAGNMGQDPETRTTSGGKKITYFSLATSRTKYVDGKPVKDDQGRRVQETEWHRITCFSGLGAIVEKYCSKGMKVSVRGRLHYSKWTDKDGNDRNGCEIVAEAVDFLTPAKQANAPTGTSQEMDDDIPF